MTHVVKHQLGQDVYLRARPELGRFTVVEVKRQWVRRMRNGRPLRLPRLVRVLIVFQPNPLLTSSRAVTDEEVTSQWP